MRKFYLPKSFIVLISFFALFSCNSDGGNVGNEESETQKIISAFEEKLETDVIEDDIASMSAAIFMDDEIVWSQAFGEANRTTEVIADSSTVYRTASISKTITAYLMMLLVQDGIIKLDDPIKNYLSEIDQIQHNDLSDFTQITFRHLASHTSGLAAEPDLENAASGPIEEWEEKVLNSIPTTHMVSEPGEHFSYSNIGYGILGLALSRAAGEPFIDLVDERVFQPLGMENSFFIISEGEEDNIAAGYSVRAFTGEIESEKAELEHAGRGYKVPNGGIYSTPNDLARFLMAQCNGSGPLSETHLETMQTIHTPESTEYGYGFGYYIRNNDKGIRMVEHDGGVEGYQAMMVFNPEYKIGVVLMRNYNFGMTNILLEPRKVLSHLVKAKSL